MTEEFYAKSTEKIRHRALRIICMLMIIVLHVYTYGGLNQLSNAQGGRFEVMSDFMWSFFRTPVNVFMIITGYFMSKDVLDFKKAIDAYQRYMLRCCFILFCLQSYHL